MSTDSRQRSANGPRRLSAALAAALVSITGCAGEPEPPARHVVVVTLDTTRQDRIGSYGYLAPLADGGEASPTPTLDALAARGARFERAYSSSVVTLPAHATLFTGTYPFRHGVRDNGRLRLGDASETLAESLQAAGFRTGAFASAAVLGPTFGLDQGFEHYDVEVSKRFVSRGTVAKRSAAATTDRALAWLASANGERLFLWIHYYDAHRPWKAPDELAARFSDPYDAEIASVDFQLTRLLDGLGTAGMLADALVIVLADHGEGLGDHQEKSHGFFIYDEVVAVPLVMAGPRVPRGLVVPGVVRTADVAPTVLALLGLPPLGSSQGTSLVAALSGEDAPRDAYFENYTLAFSYGWSFLEGLRRGDLKYVDAPQPELYDLAADPGETRNLAAERPDDLAALAEALDRVRGSAPSAGLASAAEPSPHTRAHLRALGYVTGTELPESRGPDPKEMFVHYRKRHRATELLDEGDPDAAIATMREFFEAVRHRESAHEDLANLLARVGSDQLNEGSAEAGRAKLREAAEHFQEVVQASPDYVLGHYNLALVQGELGKRQKQVTAFERCLELDPDFGPALYFLGLDDMLRGEFERALARLDQYVALADTTPGEAEPQVAHGALMSGVCLLNLGRYAEAGERFRGTAVMAPSWSEPDFWLGRLAFDQGQAEPAREHFSRFLEDPDSPDLAEQARQMLTKLDAS